MKLLLLIPNLKGYQTTLGDNYALTARASGLPRRRRVRVGAAHHYELNFTVKNGDFDYLMAFWRLTQDQAFACQLISDTSQIRWERVRWASVPRITNKGGGVFGVSVQAVQDPAKKQTNGQLAPDLPPPVWDGEEPVIIIDDLPPPIDVRPPIDVPTPPPPAPTPTTPPPPTDEFAGFSHTEQRVGFFSTRKFTEENWVDYLKNGTVPTRYNRYDYSIYTDPFILKLTFNEIVNETARYLSTLLDEGLQKRKYQNPNIEFADTAPYIIIELQESQPIAYAQDDFNGLINKDLNWGNFKAIKPLSNNFTNEIDFDVRQSDYYNSNTEKMWNDYVINNFHPLTIRNRETIGVVGKKLEFGKNAPAEYFKLSNEIPTDGFHTFSVKLFKKCLYSYNGLPAGNVTVSAPIYLNMISLIAKRNSEQYFDIFPKNLIENGVNYA